MPRPRISGVAEEDDFTIRDSGLETPGGSYVRWRRDTPPKRLIMAPGVLRNDTMRASGPIAPARRSAVSSISAEIGCRASLTTRLLVYITAAEASLGGHELTG